MSSSSLFKVGARVSVIHDTLKGEVVSVENYTATIKDQDGFVRVFKLSELALDSDKEHYSFDDELLERETLSKLKEVSKENSSTANEIDLHIENLLDSHLNMTNHEILTFQLKACKKFVHDAIENGTKKIVLVHGKGEGVLRNEIHSFLLTLKKLHDMNLEFYDASYQRFGIGGATEVLFY